MSVRALEQVVEFQIVLLTQEFQLGALPDPSRLHIYQKKFPVVHELIDLESHVLLFASEEV